ncbi:peptidase, S8/S53 subfamily protein [Acanthamoeba castellanii str. Neff]|uniref:Peptidase, S8/S53 subfamily protein n=1 Tax=Acanthamoeba castellanii (strain ATCC 30010 / Neff) TaxID=1257118 RepID=L8GLP0_ACACF|nr:peptidase, S8/S53 subfamily protein [Acanthamoeba castellanii str. Neff]ELR13759.1 peptidase, S8/S53 subfamily protein [Acanthamoeba castellanii str. Neff]
MMVQVTVPAALRHRQHEIVESLRDKTWVEFIEPNVVMRSTATQTLSSSSSIYPWGLDRIDQRHLPLNERYEYVTPTSGVRVYVIDTGILTTHIGRAVWGTNTVDSKDYDCYGHGTHVAGIVAGTNVGVAKDVTVVAVKALDCTGSGTAGTVSLGIAWVIQNCPVGVRCIISLSLGGEQSSVMDSAVKAAYNKGIVVVSAAGNSNIDACTVTPARSPYGITVGATNSDDAKAFFSNWGGCVNIWAPGVDIPSAYFTSDTTYQKLSGTSQATPHVTGAVALYLGATKNVTPSEAAGAVYASATLNTVTGTDSSSINRFLYSQVDRGVVPKTAADACSSSFPCTSVNGSLSGLNTVNVPSGQITVTSTVASYGYLQAWLEATADFDLRLQFYNTSTTAWVNVATSTGGTGSEWIQFATSASVKFTLGRGGGCGEQGIKRIYPTANLTKSADWAGFPHQYTNVYFLSPLDSLYKTIGSKVIRLVEEEFGTDHIYNADTFNEMSPPSADPTYLAAASRAVYEGMATQDPQALWVMQGWSFVFDPFWTKDRIKAYLSGVDNSDMLILDLASDNSPEWNKTGQFRDSYFGKEFVWCMLHNGGGVRGLYGNLTQYSSDPLIALATPGNTMVGVGMTMEAIEQNPVVYELMSEMGWRSEAFDIVEWVQRYAERRYGLATGSSPVGEAWELLREATYNQSGLDAGLFGFAPALGMGHGGTSNATKEVEALRLFLQSAQTEGYAPNGPWQYDCVDLTRQVLANTFNDVYSQLDAAYTSYATNKSDTLPFLPLAAELLGIISDLDRLLATNPNYLLGTWIKDAVSWASIPEQALHYQFNARNQITLWGPDGQISDYATKHWAGLLMKAVGAGVMFNSTAYGTELLQLEQKWNQENTTYPTTPTGDTLQVALRISQKYLDRSAYESYFIKVANTDAYGSDLMPHPTWSTDLAQLQWLCLANPLCRGFNTNGWLKGDVSRRVPNAPTDLYIRRVR